MLAIFRIYPQGQTQWIFKLMSGFVSKQVQNMLVWEISERSYLIKQ